MRETVADTLDWHSRLLDKHEIEFAIMEISKYSVARRSVSEDSNESVFASLANSLLVTTRRIGL